MILKMFTVKDLKAAVYLRPVSNVNAGAALRDFGDEVSTNEKSMLNKHPEDFQLFEIGEFDDQTGQLIPTIPVKYLAQGTDFVAARPVTGQWQPDKLMKELAGSANGGTK